MWLCFSRLYDGKLHTIWTPLSQHSVPYTCIKAVSRYWRTDPG